MTNEICEQAVKVFLRSTGQLLLGSQSIGSFGLLGIHGKFIKITVNETDEIIGQAIRACLNNRNPGYRQYQMHTEKEAFQAVLAEYHKDRGEISDKKFFKGTKAVNIYEYSKYIEFLSGDNTPSGHGAFIKDPPPIRLPLDASDLELARALRLALERSLA